MGSSALRFVRVLYSNKNLQSNRMKSILISILRVLVNDSSQNQATFNRLLEYGKDKSTLGQRELSIFSKAFIGCSKVRKKKKN